jgi:hypothetical protein
LPLQFREHVIGGLGPGERLAVFVPAPAEPADCGGEVVDAGEVAATSAWRSMMEKNTSTMFNQLAEVGVKCSRTRVCLANIPLRGWFHKQLVGVRGSGDEAHAHASSHGRAARP